MTQQVAYFLDLGYLLANGSEIISGQNLSRERIGLNVSVLHQHLHDHARDNFPGKPVLRVYVYDGPHNRPQGSPIHEGIEQQPGMRLRLGLLNNQGSQKAVDTMLVVDLLHHAHTGTISDAVVISGDADLYPGIVAAQDLGVRTGLIRLEGDNASPSHHLLSVVDFLSVWDAEVISAFVNEQADEEPGEAVWDAETLEFAMIRNVALVADEVDLDSYPTGAFSIPQVYDTMLLKNMHRDLNRSLDESERVTLRAMFKTTIASKLGLVPARD